MLEGESEVEASDCVSEGAILTPERPIAPVICPIALAVTVRLNVATKVGRNRNAAETRGIRR